KFVIPRAAFARGICFFLVIGNKQIPRLRGAQGRNDKSSQFLGSLLSHWEQGIWLPATSYVGALAYLSLGTTTKRNKLTRFGPKLITSRSANGLATLVSVPEPSSLQGSSNAPFK